MQNASEKDMGIKALILGINEYVSSRALLYCVKDATSVGNLLQTTYDMKDILLLTDDMKPRFKPLRSNILSNIRLISATAEENDNLLFYFAGHGKDIAGEPVLLPSDYRDEIGLDAAIRIEDIKKEFVSSKAKFKLLIFDSCHSGAVKGRDESGRMSRSTFDELNDVPEGFAIISACGLNQISFEDGKLQHGVFTFHLLEGMKGKADANKNNEVTINELYDYVTPKVKDWVFREHNTSQIPHMRSNFSGVYVVSRFPREKTESKDISEAKLSPDVGPLPMHPLFRELFQFAWSSGGLNMSSRVAAHEFALQWIDDGRSDQDFKRFKELFQFAWSSGGLNMSSRVAAKKYALKWLDKKIGNRK